MIGRSVAVVAAPFGSSPTVNSHKNFGSLIFIGVWRQTALTGATVVFTQMGKIALARTAGDWAKK
jgi:hypothetical protein